MRFAVGAMALLAVCGCTSSNPGLGGGAPCEITAGGDLLLRGPTSSPMLACLQKLALKPVDRVIVDSSGGPIVTAMAIGELLADLRAEMIVRGQCNSSCANYFLPVARKITVEAGSTVLLHGSVDGSTIASQQDKGLADQVRQQFELQMAYVEKYDIARGWLLMRDAEERQARRGSKFTAGRIAQPFWTGAVNVKAVLVEESFMRSCLANIEIVPFSNTIAQRVYTDGALARSLAKQGVFPTGTMSCLPSTVLIGDSYRSPVDPIDITPLGEGVRQ